LAIDPAVIGKVVSIDEVDGERRATLELAAHLRSADGPWLERSAWRQ